MGDEDEDEGCAVELQITEGGCGIPKRLPRTGGKSQRPAELIRPPVPAANLTGHEEKVSVENFALLKVLGTGGEEPRSLGQCPWHGALGLLPAHPPGPGPGFGEVPPPFPGTAPLSRPALPYQGSMPTCRASTLTSLLSAKSCACMPPCRDFLVSLGFDFFLRALYSFSPSPLESPTLVFCKSPSPGLHIPPLFGSAPLPPVPAFSSFLSSLLIPGLHVPRPLSAPQAFWSCKLPRLVCTARFFLGLT